MKIQFIACAMLLANLLTACGDNNNGRFTFKTLEDFIIKEDALADSSEVQLIYCSFGPGIHQDMEGKMGVIARTSNKNDEKQLYQIMDYYLQYVVIESKTRDTFNILSPIATNLSMEDKTSSFIYTKSTSLLPSSINQEGIEGAVEKLEASDAEENDVNQTLQDLMVDTKNHNTIAWDPEFAHVAANAHKTVIGGVFRK